MVCHQCQTLVSGSGFLVFADYCKPFFVLPDFQCPIVEMAGLEPATTPASVGHSNRLSYISRKHLVKVLRSVSVPVTNGNLYRLWSPWDLNPEPSDYESLALTDCAKGPVRFLNGAA